MHLAGTLAQERRRTEIRPGKFRSEFGKWLIEAMPGSRSLQAARWVVRPEAGRFQELPQVIKGVGPGVAFVAHEAVRDGDRRWLLAGAAILDCAGQRRGLPEPGPL